MKSAREHMQERNAGSSLVNRDFLASRLEPQEIQALLQLYSAGSITQKTLLDQLAEGEVLGDEFDVEEELEATQAGGLSEVTPQPEPEEEEDATMPEAQQEEQDEQAE